MKYCFFQNRKFFHLAYRVCETSSRSWFRIGLLSLTYTPLSCYLIIIIFCFALRPSYLFILAYLITPYLCFGLYYLQTASGPNHITVSSRANGLWDFLRLLSVLIIAVLTYYSLSQKQCVFIYILFSSAVAYNKQ